MSKFRALLVLGGLLAISVLLVACGGDDDDDDDGVPETTIDAIVREFSLVPAVTSGPAGPFAFDVDNRGPALAHEFKVIRTDLARWSWLSTGCRYARSNRLASVARLRAGPRRSRSSPPSRP